MKTIALVLTAVALLITSFPASSEAGRRHWRKSDHAYDGDYRRDRRYYSHRDYDRLPIRITRPPDTGHYQYQDFPLWAARAFQPHGTR